MDRGLCGRLGDRRTTVGRAVARLVNTLSTDRSALVREMGAFHRRFRVYSPLNRMLIQWQRSDATMVRGRRAWERDGCTVRKGTRAVFIIGPALRAGQQQEVTRFRWLRVYDVSDVDGTPPAQPPFPPPEDPSGRAPRLVAGLERRVQKAGCELVTGYPMINCACDGATNGYTIWVRPGLAPAERAAVLAHEIAHVRLHFRPPERGQRLDVDDPAARPQTTRELQAELTAFLVLALRGLDMSDGAGAYLCCWEASQAALRAELPLALATATGVVSAIEGRRAPRRVTKPAKAEPVAPRAQGVGRRRSRDRGEGGPGGPARAVLTSPRP